jgi:spore germination cell wall hydrolase CwlJ-like protein
MAFKRNRSFSTFGKLAVIASAIGVVYAAVAPETVFCPAPETRFITATTTKSLFDTKEFQCLVRNVYHEARGESMEGQVLVAKTVLNRVADPRWPNNICSVVYQPKQFSWTHTKKDHKMYDATAIKRAKEAAYAAFYTNVPVLFFHANYVAPKWAGTREKVAVVGKHIFYQ